MHYVFEISKSFVAPRSHYSYVLRASIPETAATNRHLVPPEIACTQVLCYSTVMVPSFFTGVVLLSRSLFLFLIFPKCYPVFAYTFW